MTTAAAVLAVDDNATIRKAISMRLGAKGFEVVTAQDGFEALKLIGQKRFDIVILDLQMPEMRRAGQGNQPARAAAVRQGEHRLAR